MSLESFDKAADDYLKGGPGSGQKGHKKSGQVKVLEKKDLKKGKIVGIKSLEGRKGHITGWRKEIRTGRMMVSVQVSGGEESTYVMSSLLTK